MVKSYFLAACLFLLSISGFSQVHFEENFNADTIPLGWTVADSGVGACKWKIRAPHLEPNNVSVTMLGSNYLFVNSDSSGTATVAKETITSPVINTNGVPVVFLSFYQFYRDRTGLNRRDTGFVEVYNGTSWVTVKQMADQTFGSGTAPVLEKINISPYLNPSLQIRFRYVSNRGFYWGIDSVKITSPAPNDLGVSAFIGNIGCGLPATYAVSVRIKNYGTQPQSNFPVSYRANASPTVTENFSGSIAGGDSADYTFTLPLAASAPGDYILKAWTALANDADHSNDTATSGVLTRAKSTIAIVDFHGYSGTNLSEVLPGWKEASGYSPTGTTSTWTISTASQLTAFNNDTAARINLYTTTKKDWLITAPVVPTPNSVLRFKLALTNFAAISADSMGSDDSLIVRVSDDCGLSWTNLRHYTKADRLTNQFTTQVISLADFAGDNILIGFYGTDGSTEDLNDYDIHIDKVEVLVPAANDVGVTQIDVPTGECGVGTTLPVKVTIYNNGFQTQTQVPVSYALNSQVPVNETFTLSLAPGASTQVTFTNPASITTGGSNQLKAWTTLGGDVNLENDSATSASFIRPPATFPLNTFNGFNGTNLSTTWPGWKEQNGIPPTGTTSNWINSTPTQSTALGGTTARVNLFGATRREWMISPAFIPESAMVVQFDAAVTNNGTTALDSMGSDDSVHVMVTTNCGTSWIRIKSFHRNSNLTNLLKKYSASLSPYVGQSIRIAFLASEGNTNDLNDYDFHLDNVEVIMPLSNDLGVESLSFPSGLCNTTLYPKVLVTNYGAAPQSSFSVSYRVNSNAAVTESLTQTLQPGEQVEHTFTTGIDVSTLTTFTLSAWSSLTNDGNALNDSVNTTVSLPGAVLSPINFTNFDGSNMSTLFPGWREQSGQQPIGTTSAWTNSVATQELVLGSATARVNLSSNTKREWLVSPAFQVLANSGITMKVAVTDRSSTTADFMGSDDSVNVMISPDCGLTWSRIYSFTSASAIPNSMTSVIIPIVGFTGNRVTMGIKATDGTVDNTNDYDFHIDDIQVGPVNETKSYLSKQGFGLFPNPASHQISLQLPAEIQSGTADILGMDGKLHRTIRLEQNETSVDVQFLAPGIYTVRLTSGQGTTVMPLVISR